MENKGLIFIPDISGFTRFINEMEIGHSRLIIQELLELLINANQIGLEISEIEGDAILFYRFGESPKLGDIYRQVEKMFVDFHRNLISYDLRRFCQCKACSAAIDLTLKVITHYGEFADFNVKNYNKLIGKDIIVAHQLLKNDIEKHEYWLVTNSMLQNNTPDSFTGWMNWNSSSKQTESGEIEFKYTQLSPLLNEIKAEPPPQPDFSKKVKVISISKEFETDIITLFHATGDFTFRSRWVDGVKKVEEINHFLPRIGTRCKCELESGAEFVYSTSYSYSPEKIEFSEFYEEEKNTVYYTLEKISDIKTNLTIDYYLEKNLASVTTFKLLKKKKIEETFAKSLKNLTELVKEIKFPMPDLS